MKKVIVSLMGIVSALMLTLGVSATVEDQQFVKIKVMASEGDIGG
ncbi:Phr protein [Bacillus cereus]|uniref:Phr protein n=1 Tax=Bacillus cereus TaxID=1396 RepID=A0A2B9E5C6_BACCE|nr:Phr protein [Bacillus cereus]PGM94551.1 Phr protein [Bacillus cereus]